ncbi:hypothetical protein I4U23_005744 [Adineta vaga]|nr:hypothetical protein I4U23_005744 [Adineta vaga]
MLSSLQSDTNARLEPNRHQIHYETLPKLNNKDNFHDGNWEILDYAHYAQHKQESIMDLISMMKIEFPGKRYNASNRSDRQIYWKFWILIVMNSENLLDALKEKHESYKKKNAYQQRQNISSNSILSSLPPLPSITNIDDSSNLSTQTDTIDTSTSSLSMTTTSAADAAGVNLLAEKPLYSVINDDIIFIKDMIEKFSRKTFLPTILRLNENYELIVIHINGSFKATIKCKCRTKLTLPIRSEPSNFVLSNFYAHLTTSTCPIVDRILKEEKRLRNKQTARQSIPPAIQSISTATQSILPSNQSISSANPRTEQTTTLNTHGINNVMSLLRAQDLCSIFQFDCKELYNSRHRACLKLKSGEFMLRPAIKNNLDYCINLLTLQLREQLSHQSENHNQGLTVISNQPDSFTNTFINGLNDNMNRSKYRYQYNSRMQRFASSVYTLRGRNVYQFLRLNLPGAFQSIPTLEAYHNEFCTNIEEGEFRFHELINYSNKINCSYVFISEDCTGVISKISYDIQSNSFIGFCPQLNNGIPSTRQYQTDDFHELEKWFDTVEKSTLVSIHTVQPVASESSAPFLLSSFGTNNQITSISILSLWLFIFDNCLAGNIRVVGYSSDADPKFLKAMRLATGYFSQLPNFNLLNRNDIFETKIPQSWIWFYMRAKQLFLCFQDSIHLATKLRNRLLSKTASLLMGDGLCLNTRIVLQKLIYITDNFISNDDDIEYDSGFDEEINDDSSTLNISSQSEDEGSEEETETNSKNHYHGMRIYSNVADKDKYKFFKIKINGKKKFIHKQTAVWYLTNGNNRLSSDRTLRVQQTHKQT